MGTSILTTKLHIPRIRRGLVSRQRLIERLNAGIWGRLTLISAPAGSGKTTLLADFALRIGDIGLGETEEDQAPNARSAIRNRVAWLSLDESDNDPTRFWTYFVAALEKVQPGIGEGVLALLHAPQAPPFESILTTLINEIANVPRDLILVLDDYHVIEARSIHDGLAFLLDHMPSNMHLVIATRTDPPLPLARLRARGQLTELRAADLRFTHEEAAIFLNQVMGLNLSAEDVAALEARTEGWIAGLQLAALSMQGRDDVSEFISLFAEFLQARLARTRPELSPELHRRAAAWYARHGLLTEAVEHALAANDFERAALLIEQVGGILLSRREASTLLRWLDALPEVLVCARPVLCLYHAWARLFTGHFDAAEARLQDLERQLAQVSREPEQREMLAQVSAIRAIIACYRGEVSQAIELSRQALAGLPEDAVSLRAMLAINVAVNLADACSTGSDLSEAQQLMAEAARASQAAGDVYAAIATFNFLAQLQAAQGRLHRAAESYRQALRLADEATRREERRLPMAGMAHIGLAVLLYAWNDLEAALQHLQAGIALGEGTGDASILGEDHIVLAEGHMALARVCQARGDVAGARDHIRAAEEHAQASHITWLIGKVAACQAQLWLMQGDLEAAVRWAHACGPRAGDAIGYQCIFGYMTSLRRMATMRGHPTSQ